MVALRCFALCLTCLISFSFLAAPSLHAREADVSDGFADLADRLLPSVVNISTTQTVESRRPSMPEGFPNRSPFEEFFREFFENRPQDRGQRRAMSLGSGFVLDADQGYIITNNHVIEGADEITVVLYDDTSIPAEVVGRDEKTDIAVLRVDTELDLDEIEWGESDDMRVGDWVIAIGNPFGLGGTVTAGIISARARNINAGPYDDFLQTDASINRGNSGGPMFNMDGEVIGINTAIYSPTGGSVGIGFAIPSSLARPVIDQLIEFGRTRRGWIGVQIQTVTEEIADGLGLDAPRGALVAAVTEDGPAAAAGVQTGDVILSFNGQEVEEMRALPRIVAETRIDATVPMTVWRKNEERRLRVTVGELEVAEEQGLIETGSGGNGPPAEETEVEALGLQLAAPSPELLGRYDLSPDTAGVVITGVGRDSEAWAKRLRPGDVIREFNQQPLATPQDVIDQVEAIQNNDDQRNVLMFVDQQGETRFVTLRIE